MGRDLMLEHQKSLPYTLYKNSFLFYRYQFDESDLLEIGWTTNFKTRVKIAKLIAKQIEDLYNKQLDCYSIKWYQREIDDTTTTFAIEIMVRLLDIVVIPIGISVSVDRYHSQYIYSSIIDLTPT